MKNMPMFGVLIGGHTHHSIALLFCQEDHVEAAAQFHNFSMRVGVHGSHGTFRQKRIMVSKQLSHK